MNKRKKAEIRIIREFLKFKGYKGLKVILHERPDAMMIIKEAGKQKKIGIEHTEYHIDASPGEPSSGRKTYSFWYEVQSSIRRRVSQRSNLQHITGLVSLKKGNLPNKSKAKDLARELVMLASHVPLGEHTKFSQEYPLLKDYLRKVTLIDTGSARCVSWGCEGAIVSSIGVSAEEIAQIIRTKAKRFSTYHWDNMERWLLISASGKTIFNSAGPCPEKINWNLPDLQSVCSSANVDRIFFWERMYTWYKEVCPGAPVVKYEWRSGKIMQRTLDSHERK